MEHFDLLYGILVADRHKEATTTAVCRVERLEWLNTIRYSELDNKDSGEKSLSDWGGGHSLWSRQTSADYDYDGNMYLKHTHIFTEIFLQNNRNTCMTCCTGKNKTKESPYKRKSKSSKRFGPNLLVKHNYNLVRSQL